MPWQTSRVVAVVQSLECIGDVLAVLEFKTYCGMNSHLAYLHWEEPTLFPSRNELLV